MAALVKTLPEFDYVYLGDHARAPYGPRSKEEIYQCALEGVRALFRRGCEVIIFACNTAAANALREIQQQILPHEFPGKRVLGVLVPTVEQITGVAWKGVWTGGQSRECVGILATEATVRSGAYTTEIHKRRPDIDVIEQACPELAPLIESGASNEDMRRSAKGYIDQLFRERAQKQPPLSAVLLGCTHYELIAPIIAELLPNGVKLYEQSGIVAESFKRYLDRHSPLREQLSCTRKRTFLTTGNATDISRMASKFYGEQIQFEHVTLA